jgi:hypothetical protein
MAVSTGLAAIAATSLAYGLKKGITQGILTGDKKKVQGGTREIMDDAGQIPDAPPAPEEPVKEVVMPTVNQEKVQKARLSALQSLRSRTGRASTLLTTQPAQNNTFG